VASRSYHLVISTAANQKSALTIAKALVEGKLAACVNIVKGARSIYRWKGRIWNKAEWLLLIRTDSKLFSRVEKTILKLHPYEVPEVIGFSITKGSKPYLKWWGGTYA